MSVTVAAAAALLTPVATPVNLMVMGPGGYRFGDYWKLGLPILVLFFVVAVLLVARGEQRRHLLVGGNVEMQRHGAQHRATPGERTSSGAGEAASPAAANARATCPFACSAASRSSCSSTRSRCWR